MKPIQLRTAGVLFALLLSGGPITAQEALTLQNTRSLSFGSFVADSGGTVTIAAGGARNASGGIVLVPSDNGQAAQFTVQGDPNATYSIDLPADFTVSLSGALGTEMTLSNFSSDPFGANGQLDSTGAQILSVGATLHVQSGQADGAYSGSFSVIVNYN